MEKNKMKTKIAEIKISVSETDGVMNLNTKRHGKHLNGLETLGILELAKQQLLDGMKA